MLNKTIKQIALLASLTTFVGCAQPTVVRIVHDGPMGQTSLELWSGGNDTSDTTEVDVDPTNDEVNIRRASFGAGTGDYVCHSEGDDVKRLSKALKNVQEGDSIAYDAERLDNGCVSLTIGVAQEPTLSTAGSDDFQLLCCPATDTFR